MSYVAKNNYAIKKNHCYEQSSSFYMSLDTVDSLCFWISWWPLSVDGSVGPEHAPCAAHFSAELARVSAVHHVARLHVFEHVTLLFPVVAAIDTLPAYVHLIWGEGGRNKIRSCNSKKHRQIHFPVLRMRRFIPDSNFSIPEPGSKRFRIHIKEFKYF